MKNKLLLLSIIYFWSIGFNYVYAQNPNETCQTATPLSVGVVCTDNFTNADLTGAVNEGAVSSCVNNIYDNWFSFVAPASGKVDIRAEDFTVYTYLIVYSGSCGQLTEVYCDASNFSFVSLNVTPSATYYIQLNDQFGFGGHPFCIEVIEPPVNDICQNAMPLAIDTKTLISTRAAKEESSSPMQKSKGLHKFPLQMEELERGTYFVVLHYNDSIQVEKISFLSNNH